MAISADLPFAQARVRVANAGFGRSYPSGPRPDGGRWGDDGTIDGEYTVQDDPPTPIREGLTDRRGDGGAF